MAAIPFSPQRKDMVEKFGDAYAEARNQLFNGPFEVVEWVHDAKLVLKRNPHYWNQDDLDLEIIDFGYITSDQRALFNLFQSDELATLQINNTILKTFPTQVCVSKETQQLQPHADAQPSRGAPLAT